MRKPDIAETFIDFEAIKNIWLDALNDYSSQQLQVKESPEIWSLGQVYSHWLDASHLYMLAKVRLCLENPQKHSDGILSDLGKQLMETNEFPAIEVKVPVKTSVGPRNEGDKSIILGRIESLQEDMERMLEILAKNPESGRSGHRFFGFMDAYQWYRLIPIHMRHHLRQKVKIDRFLKQQL